MSADLSRGNPFVYLYLVQHGEATPETEDPARPLTGRGRDEVTRVARHAATLGLQVVEICHSGKLRARQTAELQARHLSPTHGIREMAGLAPTDDPGRVAAEVEAARDPLMLVGHLPHLSRLASCLLVADSAREILRFRTGGIVCLVRVESGWRLQWVLTPDVCLPRSGSMG
jgi:phosphohistidine phosphatase